METPTYLIENEVYLYNLLDALLSLNLNGKKTIMGYSNQQSLIYLTVGAGGLATGNFRNVRSFDVENFHAPTDEIKRKATWYYDGNTFSEFRLERLGLAYNRGLRGEFGPTTIYSEQLINTSNPLSVIWINYKHLPSNTHEPTMVKFKSVCSK